MGKTRLEAFSDPGSEEDEPISRPPAGTMVFCLFALAVFGAVVVLAYFAKQPAPSSSDVRILNVTQYPFHQVVINGELYGTVNPGEYSGYRSLRAAYRYASVRLIAGNHEMRFTPDDYVGETPLGSGKFTYVLNIVDADRIDISVTKDSP
jgi:hypothetical protein